MPRRASSSQSAKTNWKKLFAVNKFLSLAKSQACQEPARAILANRYLIGQKFANGAFGQVRLGTDLAEQEEQVAIKLEPSGSRLPMLHMEYRCYKILGEKRGLPKIYHFGPCGKYKAMVMELLGPNLEELFNECRRQFSIKTILMIGLQMLDLVQFIHSHGIISRDIKPENCLIGRPEKGDDGRLHLVDFGLAKEYINPATGKHVPFTSSKSLTGTVRYMSIRSHQGQDQSRRDDMEALGYVLYYFLSRGKLPWQGVRCEDIRKRYEKIAAIKRETPISKLSPECPWEFSVYLSYCRGLKFTQQPDYHYLSCLFRSCLKRLGEKEDYIFDWMIPKVSLQEWKRLSQNETGTRNDTGTQDMPTTKELCLTKLSPDAASSAQGRVEACASAGSRILTPSRSSKSQPKSSPGSPAKTLRAQLLKKEGIKSEPKFEKCTLIKASQLTKSSKDSTRVITIPPNTIFEPANIIDIPDAYKTESPKKEVEHVLKVKDDEASCHQELRNYLADILNNARKRIFCFH